MLGKASAACFGTALVLATLALASAGLNQGREERSAFLEALTTVFVVVAIIFLTMCVILGVMFVVVWVWRYFHAVEVIPGELYCRYWPHEQRAEVSGAKVRIREWAGRVKVTAHAQFVKDEVKFEASEFPGGSDGIYGLAFPQKKVDFAGDPKEGDRALAVIRAEPLWWHGRASQRVLRATIAVTDHRPTPPVTPEQVREAIARIDPLIAEAQKILEACGRPREQMRGADPMYFLNVCMPRINNFALDATTTIREVAPEYLGKFQNVGNVTHGTDVKPAAIQQVERWLENLGAIQDELRKRL